MSVVTFLVALRPVWRAKAAWWVVAGDAVVFLLALTAKQSGRNLQARLTALLRAPVAVQHGREGTWVPWFALAVLIAAILVALTINPGPVVAGITITLAALAGGAAIGWVVLTGDSGA